MKSSRSINRREFLTDSATLFGAGSLIAGESRALVPQVSSGVQPPATGPLKLGTSLEHFKAIWILVEPTASFKEKLASRELARGLRNLGVARNPIQAVMEGRKPEKGEFRFVLQVRRERFKHPEAYEIALEGQASKEPVVRFAGATPQALLYAVFDFLERQGALFGLEGEVYPPGPLRELHLPPPGHPWEIQPRFSVRGLNPWQNLLESMGSFDRVDYRAYLEAMLRMRFNMLGLHVYAGRGQYQLSEPYLSFEYGGTGYEAYTDTTATSRWGCLPERTSRYGMGAADFYPGDVWGPDATIRARNCWEDHAFAQTHLDEAFRYAQQLGIRTGIGFEPYVIPDEIFQAIPPEARFARKDPNLPGPRIDPESAAARDILEARLGRLLETYPSVDYVWLWEDESMTWASRMENVPLSVTAFQQAHDFLKRHAPEKRLVVSGWGGVVRNFPHFHRVLPADVIFTCMTDYAGWQTVSEEFARLEGRERWAIPWLEDDLAIWLPQFHVYRMAGDMDRAERFGCQGLLGVHWRQRITDANAGFQARYSWDSTLKPERYFRAFASAQARPPVSTRLAEVLDETDRERLLLCTFTGQMKNGLPQTHAYSGDYGEAFTFWRGYEPPASVKKSQAEVARKLRTLTEAASSPFERERLNYLARRIEFLVPYAESWSLAYHLQQVLDQAKQLKEQGKAGEAEMKVRAEGVPLWLKLAPQVREALLAFQEVVSGRDDIGTLGSMHNKYERLALARLSGSMKEFLRQFPPEVERALVEARRPNPQASARVFIPARPTLLHPGDQVRILAVAAGVGATEQVTLFTRSSSEGGWQAAPMRLLGRRTFVSELAAHGAPALFLDYYIQATLARPEGRMAVTAPLEAPSRFYTATIA